MSTVTPFRAKARAYCTPIDMLRALAKLDATLVYSRHLNGDVEIGFDAPQRTHAEFNAILEVPGRAGETWRHAYIAAVLDLLAIEDSSVEPLIGETFRLRLRSAFIDKVPDTGAETFRLFVTLNDEVGQLQSERPSDRWLSAVNRRNDLLRLMQSMAGSSFGVDAAREAQRFADERGINLEVK